MQNNLNLNEGSGDLRWHVLRVKFDVFKIHLENRDVYKNSTMGWELTSQEEPVTYSEA